MKTFTTCRGPIRISLILPLDAALSAAALYSGAIELVPDVHLVGPATVAGAAAGHGSIPQALQRPRAALARDD